jgi:hypothetical protein
LSSGTTPVQKGSSFIKNASSSPIDVSTALVKSCRLKEEIAPAGFLYRKFCLKLQLTRLNPSEIAMLRLKLARSRINGRFISISILEVNQEIETL